MVSSSFLHTAKWYSFSYRSNFTSSIIYLWLSITINSSSWCTLLLSCLSSRVSNRFLWSLITLFREPIVLLSLLFYRVNFYFSSRQFSCKYSGSLSDNELLRIVSLVVSFSGPFLTNRNVSYSFYRVISAWYVSIILCFSLSSTSIMSVLIISSSSISCYKPLMHSAIFSICVSFSWMTYSSR